MPVSPSTVVHPHAVRRSGAGLWFLLLAGTLWGTGGLTGSLLARETGLAAPAVATYRLGVGGLLLVLLLLLTRRPLPRGRRAWTRIAVLGLLAAGFQVSYFAAVSRVSVSLATLLTIGASPVLVLLAEAVGARRRAAGGRVDRRALATVAIAVTGLTLLVGVPSGGRDVAAMLVGGGFALLAAGGFATMTLVGARPVDGLDDLAVTGFGFTLGAAALVPLGATGAGLAVSPAPAALALLLLLGVGPTAIAYAAYFRGLRTATPGTAALMALLEPLVATGLAVVILGDRLGAVGLAGAVVLITALVLAALRGSATPEG